MADINLTDVAYQLSQPSEMIKQTLVTWFAFHDVYSHLILSRSM